MPYSVNLLKIIHYVHHRNLKLNYGFKTLHSLLQFLQSSAVICTSTVVAVVAVHCNQEQSLKVVFIIKTVAGKDVGCYKWQIV